MRIFAAVFAIALVTGCENGDTRDLRNASGETPIKFVICSLGETNCFVAARFKDMDGCQSHKDWADMLCTKNTTAGEMLCKQDKGSKIAVAYCTL